MPVKTKWKSSLVDAGSTPNFPFQVLVFFLFSFAIQNDGRVYCAESGSLFNPSVIKMAHNDWAHLV